MPNLNDKRVCWKQENGETLLWAQKKKTGITSCYDSCLFIMTNIYRACIKPHALYYK